METVLLFDEIDPLFSNNFYGEVHNPVALFKNADITSLIEHIWEES